MEKPRFRFTIKGLLWATFWVAVCAASWTFFLKLWATQRFDFKVLTLIIVALVGLATPFVAIGALFGKPVKGLSVFGGILLLGPEAWLLIGLLIFVVITTLAGWIRALFG